VLTALLEYLDLLAQVVESGLARPWAPALLEYELTPLPLSLFTNKDHKMNKANKAIFSNTSLKVLTDPLDLTDQPCSSLVVDGGWLLYLVKWEQGHTL